MAQTIPEFRQRGNMPIHASPHTPPKVPNLFGKGALEKKVRNSLFTYQNQGIQTK